MWLYSFLQKNEDDSVDISLQMRYSPERWKILDEYINSNTALSEDMFRRSMGYVEEAIYQPTIIEKIGMAWTEYIQVYLIEYKVRISCFTKLNFGISAYQCRKKPGKCELPNILKG